MEGYSVIKSHTIAAHINPGEPQGRDVEGRSALLKITEAAVYFSFNLHRLVCSSLMVLLLVFTYIGGLLSLLDHKLFGDRNWTYDPYIN